MEALSNLLKAVEEYIPPKYLRPILLCCTYMVFLVAIHNVSLKYRLYLWIEGLEKDMFTIVVIALIVLVVIAVYDSLKLGVLSKREKELLVWFKEVEEDHHLTASHVAEEFNIQKHEARLLLVLLKERGLIKECFKQDEQGYDVTDKGLKRKVSRKF